MSFVVLKDGEWLQQRIRQQLNSSTALWPRGHMKSGYGLSMLGNIMDYIGDEVKAVEEHNRKYADIATQQTISLRKYKVIKK